MTDKINYDDNNKKGGLPARRQEGNLARKLRVLRTLRQDSMNKSMNMSTTSFSESSLMDFQSPRAVMDFQSPRAAMDFQSPKTITRGSIRDLGKTIEAPPFLLSPTTTRTECSLNSSSTSLSFEQIFSTDGDDDEVDEFLGSVVAYSTCLP